MNPVHEILIVKYLSGEATPEEAIQVDEWIDSAPENREQFDAWLQAWNASGQQRYTEVDRVTAWKETQALIARQQPASRKIINLYWIAAAAVVLIGGLWIFLPVNNPVRIREEMMSFQPGSSGATLRLQDNSVVTLNQNGQLIYPVAFSGTERNVTLKGEGFFKISPDPRHPFIIQAGPVKIRVTGTAFNVKLTDTSVITQVHEGSVEMFNEKGKLQLSARQSGIFHLATNAFQLLQHFFRNDAAYATHIFDFDNVALPEVLQTISNAYKVKIVLKNPALNRLRLTAQFDNKPLNYMLEVIANTFKIKYSKGEDDSYYFD